MKRDVLRGAVRNGWWLMVPAMAWNIALTAKLPPVFAMDRFWHAIPPYIGLPENILRIALFILPALAMCGSVAGHKRGYALFLFGLVIYFASWIALICGPQSAWSTSAAGFMAPAYTPALWLGGMALVLEPYAGSRKLFRIAFLAIAAAFLVFHNSHALIVLLRQ